MPAEDSNFHNSSAGNSESPGTTSSISKTEYIPQLYVYIYEYIYIYICMYCMYLNTLLLCVYIIYI